MILLYAKPAGDEGACAGLTRAAPLQKKTNLPPVSMSGFISLTVDKRLQYWHAQRCRSRQ